MMSVRMRLSNYVGPAVIIALGAVTMASAQSASPFATKKKKQAWEQEAPAQAPVTQPPTYQPPTYPQTAPAQTYPTYTPPTTSSYPAQSYPAQTAPTSSGYDYTPPAPAQYPSANTAQPQNAGTYYPGRQYQNTAGPDVQGANEAYDPTPYQWRQPQAAQPSSTYQGSPYGAPQQTQPYPQAPTYGGQQAGAQQQARSWKDKFGLRNWRTKLSGSGRVGVAATERDSWSEDFIADADVEFEASTVTQGGLEYGINLGARAQYDKYRRGFGQRLNDCPPTQVGCASVDIDGTPTALRGHTSQFYSFGPDNAKETEVQLESAYLFLRSAYGDVTLGRDDGAAYLFSLGAPTLLAVGASNSPVDYTGLDSVKTVNDASGFSEKITYTTPRLLGDTVGVGVQIGASYAPNARACGVDYCVKRNDVTGAATPDLKDIMEAGIALDRTFANGMKIEGTATYATGKEDSGIAAFDDLTAYNVGLEVSLDDWTLGGSWLNSNNGLAAGDYEAWDVGLTWKPSQLGFTLGYGQATDDNVQLKSNQAVFGVSYDVNETFTLGTGVQYVDRETPIVNAGVVEANNEKATSIFVEGGFKF